MFLIYVESIAASNVHHTGMDPGVYKRRGTKHAMVVGVHTLTADDHFSIMP